MITSPLFPDHDYPNNVTCYWRIRAHKKRVISITINSLNTEEPYDFLEVKQGRWYTLSPFVERYTGKPDLPIQLTLNSNNAWIRFTSDRYVSAPGFSLTYRAHRKQNRYLYRAGVHTVLFVYRTEIRCPRLPSPPNGLKLEQNRTVGGYVLFGCRQGFRIEGEPKIKCLAMGKWNNKSPSCLGMSRSPQSPAVD